MMGLHPEPPETPLVEAGQTTPDLSDGRLLDHR